VIPLGKKKIRNKQDNKGKGVPSVVDQKKEGHNAGLVRSGGIKKTPDKRGGTGGLGMLPKDRGIKTDRTAVGG